MEEISEFPARFCFKAIDVDLSSSNDSLDADQVSPIDIFRGTGESSQHEFLPTVHRANPIDEQRASFAEVDTAEGRLISPYPFSPEDDEASRPRDELPSTSSWTEEAGEEKELIYVAKSAQADFSRYFDMDYFSTGDAIMDCDDFSVSSEEVMSLSQDPCLDTISEDPVSFWEEGIEVVCTEQRYSPTQISLGSPVPGSPVGSHSSSSQNDNTSGP